MTLVENVPLNAYSRSGKQDTKKDDETNARSYVIGDYDDSDDGLVDLEDDDVEGKAILRKPWRYIHPLLLDAATSTHKPDEKTSTKPTH